MFDIVTIHQPVFLPYTGIIDKIRNADVFMFLDDVQFEDNGFQHRNRILTKVGVVWLTVPLKSPRYKRNLKEIMISNNTAWHRSMLDKIQHNYGKCPYFAEVFQLMRDILEGEHSCLVDLNIRSMLKILEYFNIKVDIKYSSHYADKPCQPTDRIVYLVQKLDGKVFLSGDAAKSYLEVDKFKDIEVRFQNYVCKEYAQKWSEQFVPYMSILDYMMYMGNDVSAL